MRKIKLADGTELDIIQVNGERVFYQNSNRDSLKFIFDKSKYDLNTIDNIFSDSNKIRTIKILEQQEIIDEETGETEIVTVNEFIHNDYVLKMSISSETIVIEEGDSTKPPVTVERIVAKVAQQTYIEKLLEQMLNK